MLSVAREASDQLRLGTPELLNESEIKKIENEKEKLTISVLILSTFIKLFTKGFQ